MTNAEADETAVYIGLGSNIGDREANLREAVARLESRGVDVVRKSSIYETEPVGFKDQSWFLNQVIETRSDTVEAESILSKLLDVEQEMGRERGIVNGPRVIDIDLLLVGDNVTASLEKGEDTFRAKTPAGGTPALPGPAKTQKRNMIVPHPRMHERRFVLEPLCEIAPEVIHPVLKKTCRAILSSLDDPSIVRLYDPAATKA